MNRSLVRVARLGCTTALGFAAAGCSLDDRSLSISNERYENFGKELDAATEPSDAGDGAFDPFDSTFEDSAFAGSDAGDTSKTGEAGSCALDGPNDCEPRFVRNASFDSAAADWKAERDTALSWRSNDADARTDSGSLVVRSTARTESDGWTVGAATQCLAITGGVSYEFGVSAYIPGDQGPGGASLTAWFFTNTGCSGGDLENYDALPVYRTQTWTPIRFQRTAPPAARSVLVRLLAWKPLRNAGFEAQFDDVLVLSK